MRRGQVAALAASAITLAGLAGCSDRPNDLDTYYDDPVTSTAAVPAPVQPIAPAAPPSAPARVDAASALLTTADVEPEGVEPANHVAAASKCLAPLVNAADPAQRREGGWEYVSGASLTHRVLTLKDAAGVVQRLACAGSTPVQLAAVNAEQRRAWCETDGPQPVCTVVLIRGELVSVVQVAASTVARATDAARRLAPIAATALARVQG